MKTTIEIQNLKCGGCAHTVTTKVGALDNVENVLVDVEESTVTFDYADEDTLQIVKDKLNSLGYPMTGENNSTMKQAKSFVSCAVGKMTKDD